MHLYTSVDVIRLIDWTMSGKFDVVLFFTLGLNIFSIVANSTAQNSCSLPPKIKDDYDYDWTSRNHDWMNAESRTDYLVLTLSWSPAYCGSLSDMNREETFQCNRKSSFDLIVHGLWPQTSDVSSVRDHPRNCHNEEQIPQSIIKRFFCLMPDEDLMQSEWEKHGSCYFPSATDYFHTIEYLFNRLNIPDIRSMGKTSYWKIKKAFLRLNSARLFPSAIFVKMNRHGQLKEIRICYDLHYNFISCKQ